MPTIKTILCPVDFSETSLAAVRKAADLACAADATLVLVHAIDQGGYLVEASSHHALMWEDYERKAHERLALLGARLDVPHPVESHVLLGRPHDVIAREVDESHADLVVMGTHGRTTLGKLFMGSVAERVVRSARVPVITVREG